MSSPYTPTTAEIRGHYSTKSSSIVGALEYTEGISEFERWLANHDAEVAATALDEATVLADSFGMISKRNLEPYWEGHDDAVDKIAQGIRDRAAEYRKTETEVK